MSREQREAGEELRRIAGDPAAYHGVTDGAGVFVGQTGPPLPPRATGAAPRLGERIPGLGDAASLDAAAAAAAAYADNPQDPTDWEQVQEDDPINHLGLGLQNLNLDAQTANQTDDMETVTGADGTENNGTNSGNDPPPRNRNNRNSCVDNSRNSYDSNDNNNRNSCVNSDYNSSNIAAPPRRPPLLITWILC